MTDTTRADWFRHIEQILRSKHYTWIAEGLGGLPWTKRWSRLRPT